MGSEIPLIRQCELVGLSRSSYYYSPRPVSPLNDLLMKLIDKQYTKTPFYGAPNMTVWLRRRGYKVNHKRIERLMRIMGIQAIFPKKRMSVPNKEHTVYPYLLRDMTISAPNEVWTTDLTYVRMRKGFIYLVAVMDWFTRYVLSWKISTTLDAAFCIDALERSLEAGRPKIFNSDRGSQFTGREFTGILEAQGISISMDGRGRVFDNIFIERLWRTVKYEEVYLKDYVDVWDAESNIDHYFRFYNTERPHTALQKKTPHEVYWGTSGSSASMHHTREGIHLNESVFLS
jgi:putative transposase